MPAGAREHRKGPTGEAALLGRGTEAVTIPLADLAHGRAGTQQTVSMTSFLSPAAEATRPSG